MRRTFLFGLALVGSAVLSLAQSATAQTPTEIKIDWATYNPVSLILKEDRLLEQRLSGTTVRWVQSAGSNKALEFLNAGSLDFGSTAGAAALLARINGNPVRAVYVYSKPEWTALVARPATGIRTPEDLRGRRIAVTRGTDPHIFLVRALASVGLTERDVRLVLLQHADGRAALAAGQVDAWAGLDPLMARAELEDGAGLVFRRPDWNTYGTLLASDSIATRHPAAVEAVIAAYEEARRRAVADPKRLADLLARAARIDAAVADRQLTRTDLSNPRLDAAVVETIQAAGLALQQVGVIEPQVDVAATVAALIQPAWTARLAQR
ncbi:MAG: aliphatic sulfonate ABC transporter substrate-binding protein [Alphaproteobacteria bacterium]|nr:aliphatic sulfonate ABC transporter substrate-binding protein [Alphaproteobacteria bacterium]TAD88027.1 MAG: aliphatic sulfonate ABC transporter substrate-binding protein [Alphaproteobacteria bacterium]